MFRRDEVTNRVRVVEIIPGDPVQITVVQHVTRPDGKVRTISQKTPVIDRCMAQRVLAEIRKGDEIAATIVTEWSKQGYTTYLVDFCAVTKIQDTNQTLQDKSVPAR